MISLENTEYAHTSLIKPNKHYMISFMLPRISNHMQKNEHEHYEQNEHYNSNSFRDIKV